MQIDSIEIVVLTALFVVPGFVFYEIYLRFVPRRTPPMEQVFLRYLAFSLGNLAFWSTVLDIGVWIGFVGPARPFFGWRLFLIGFVGPVGLALLTLRLQRSARLQAIARRIINTLHLQPIDPVPTAWEHAFTALPASWLHVWLEDGTELCGQMSEGDYFASSDPDERDLLMVKYDLDDSGQPVRPKRRTKVLIRSHQIRRVEFISDLEGEPACVDSEPVR